MSIESTVAKQRQITNGLISSYLTAVFAGIGALGNDFIEKQVIGARAGTLAVLIIRMTYTTNNKS